MLSLITLILAFMLSGAPKITPPTTPNPAIQQSFLSGKVPLAKVEQQGNSIFSKVNPVGTPTPILSQVLGAHVMSKGLMGKDITKPENKSVFNDIAKSATAVIKKSRPSLLGELGSVIDRVKELGQESATNSSAPSLIQTDLPEAQKFIGLNTARPFQNYDMQDFGTSNPKYTQDLNTIHSKLGDMSKQTEIEGYLKQVAPHSPLNAKMIQSAALKYEVDPKVLISLFQEESTFGTAGESIRTRNPANIGNNENGKTRTFLTWGAGVQAAARWLSKSKLSPGDLEYINTIHKQ